MSNQLAKGFTIVELFVVVSSIVVLASITVFGFGSWRERTAKTEVKNELVNASNALKDNLNFNNTYPVSGTLGTVYSPKSRVILTYVRRVDMQSYCLRGQSIENGSVILYIDSTKGQVPSTVACN